MPMSMARRVRGSAFARSMRAAIVWRMRWSQSGVKKGERIGLLMMNSAEFMEAYFALAKVGAVVVPLNWRLVPDELEFILKDSGTTRLIYGEEFLDTRRRAARARFEDRRRAVAAGRRSRTDDRFCAELSAFSRRGVRRRTDHHRARRRPPVHHVHVRYDRSAERRGAHAQHGDVGCADDCRRRRTTGNTNATSRVCRCSMSVR